MGRIEVDVTSFRAPAGGRLRLAKAATRIAPHHPESRYDELLQQNVRELSHYQQLLYAYDRYALLIVLQAMDAAGKDGVIKHVMSGVNPQGCEVFGFRQPSTLELEHDFLWRAARRLPQRGRIGIFNRSYYEEVLVVRVHPELLNAQRLPPKIASDRDIWKKRYQSIVDFERHLHRNGTRILKFFLNVSPEEQRQRLLARTEHPEKSWKAKLSDLNERTHWHEYMRAYEECINATHSRHAPWYVIPSDDKDQARLIVAEVIVHSLKRLKMDFPEPDTAQRRAIHAMRRRLIAEAPERSGHS